MRNQHLFHLAVVPRRPAGLTGVANTLRSDDALILRGEGLIHWLNQSRAIDRTPLHQAVARLIPDLQR